MMDEFSITKRLWTVLLAGIVICPLFTACGKSQQAERIPDIGSLSHYTEENFDQPDIQVIQAETVYTASDPTISFQLVNESEESYTYGDAYELEYWEGGSWYTVTPAESQVVQEWLAVAMPLGARETKEREINLSYYGTEFPPGRYRIVFDVVPEENQQTEHPRLIRVEFELREQTG